MRPAGFGYRKFADCSRFPVSAVPGTLGVVRLAAPIIETRDVLSIYGTGTASAAAIYASTSACSISRLASKAFAAAVILLT